MRKIISKIAGLMLGLSLAAGAGSAFVSRNANDVKAAAPYDFTGTEIVFANQGLSNSVQYIDSAFASTDFSIQFAGGGNDGKYYTTGAGMRTYGGGSFTVTGISGTLTGLTFSWDGSNKPSSNVASVGTFNSPYTEWSGSATSVTFTRPSGSGHWRLKSVVATLSGGTSSTYTVQFNSNGGTAVESITDIASGTTIAKPTDPTKSNCTFVGWYTDSALTSAFSFSTTITKNYTLYAKWTYNPSHAGTSADPYSVADTIGLIDNQGGSSVYGKGYVFNINSPYSSQYGNVSFDISDSDSSTTPFVRAYRCKSGTVTIDSEDSVQVGDVVTIKGNLTKYGSTYEFAEGCTLEERIRNVDVSELTLSGTDVSSNTMSIGSSDTSAHTVNVAINSDATDKVVNIVHQSGSSIFTLSSASITCNSSGAGSFTVTGTEATAGSETFRVSSNSNPTVYQDLVVTALDDSVVYHVVSFNSNGGSASPADQNVEHGTTFTFPSAGTKEYHSFAGWSSDGGTTKYAASATSPVVNGDVSYTAYWTEDAKYTVTYTAGTNGSGSFADANIYAGSYTLKAFDNLTGVSADEGYRFKNYTVNGTNYNAGDPITISGATAVTVNFEEEPNETTISKTIASIVSANGYTVSAGSDIGDIITSLSLDSVVTVSTSGEPNCGTFWDSGNQWRLYQNKGGDLTISVTSGHSLISVKITFSVSSNGQLLDGSDPMTSGTIYSVSGSSVTYTVGASSGTSGQVRITAIEVVYSTDGSAPTTYTITYNGNGQTSGSMSPTVGTNPAVVACTFAKDGYSFARWNTQADGEGDDYAVGTTVLADITLYAIWQENIAPIGADVTMTGTTEAASASVNEHDAVKCGTGKAAGAMKLTLTKANITKIKVYIAGWNNDTGSTINVEINNSASISMNGEPVSSITVAHDSGIANNSPFTLSGDEADYKFVFDISNNAPAGTEIVFTAANASKNRFVVWGATNLFAETFASEFASNLTCDVSGENGPSIASGYNWASFESIYNGLDEEEQGRLHDATFTVSGTGSSTVVTATGDTVQSVADAIAKYDYIVAKYGTSSYANFINRSITPLSGAPYLLPAMTNNNSSTIIIVVVALTSITSIGVLLVIKRKRSLVK